MSQLAGIEFEINAAGSNGFVRMNIENQEDSVQAAADRAEFEIDWERGVDPETFRMLMKEELKRRYHAKYGPKK